MVEQIINPILGSALGAIAPYPQASNLYPFNKNNGVVIPNIGEATKDSSGWSKTLFGLSFLAGAVVGGYVAWSARPYIDGYKKIRQSILEED